VSDKPSNFPNNQEKAKMGAVAKFVKPEQSPASSANSKSEEVASSEIKTKKPSFLNKINEFLKKKFCSEQEVVGVEIQPDTIRICQAKQTEDGWKIEKLASASVLNNYQQDSLKKNKKLYSTALKEIFDKNKITNKSVALAIPASTAIIKTISLPLMTRENLERATKISSFWQNLVQISDNLADYSIYYKIVKESPATKEMDVLFIASKKEELKTYIEIAKEAGLEPCVIDVGCFSINNISKLKADNVINSNIFIKVGRDENYLQVLEDGKPYIYDIFVSDNEKNYLHEFLENATFQQRFISQLKHLITKHEDKQKIKIDKIGVISSEPNIDKFITAISHKMDNITISISDFFDKVKLPESILTSEEFQKNKSSYAVAAGLSTRNLDIFADENSKNISELVNLMPDAKATITNLKGKFYSKILTWGASLICALIILVYGLISIGQYHHVYKETIKFNELSQKYSEQQAIFNDINGQSAILNKLVKIKESINTNQQNIIKTYQEIALAIPEGVWLEDISFDEENKILITGRSFEERNIISFSKAFDESQILQNISISTIKSTPLENGSVVREFSITGEIKDSEGQNQEVQGGN
jgi:type IV pilus assembly protein PilN